MRQESWEIAKAPLARGRLPQSSSIPLIRQPNKWRNLSMNISTVSRWIAKSCMLFVVAFFTTAVAFAQVTTGSIQGVVTDPNKAVVPGVTVKITNVDTGVTREATTNDEGFYRVTNLQPGNHY